MRYVECLDSVVVVYIGTWTRERERERERERLAQGLWISYVCFLKVEVSYGGILHTKSMFMGGVFSCQINIIINHTSQ